MALKYRISLQVSHPTADPENIVAGVGLPAIRTWATGSTRSTPTGRALEGHYDETYCAFEVTRSADGKLAEALREAITFLKRSGDYLAQLRETGGAMRFYISWTVGDHGEVLDAQLLADIADLGIDLGIEAFA